MVLPRVAVVGAGLSGLACARALQANGAASVVVFEKSLGLGGRCATVQWRGSVVDHGVQFLTLRSAVARDLVSNGLGLGKGSGLLRALPLSAVVRADDHAPIPISGGERLYHVHGNKRFGYALGEGLDVRLQHTVLDVQPDGHLEIRDDKEGDSFTDVFDAVVCSAPLPQSVELLDSETPADWKKSFAPNITLVLEYEESKLDPGSLAHAAATGRASRLYAQYPNAQSVLAWTACENAKRGRAIAPGKTIMVAQASDAFSSRHFASVPPRNTTWVAGQAADPAFAAEMVAALEEMWRIPRGARVASLSKRWRYARVIDGARVRDVSHIERPTERVLFCGDGVARRSRCEHALLNGLHCAQLVAGLLCSSSAANWSRA